MGHPFKQVLVAGGAGFLGSHLCAALLKQGQGVICLDNFSTGSRSNIEALLSSPGFSCVAHDVTIPMHYEVKEVFNFACPASPVQYQKNPLHTLKTNMMGSLHLLELAVLTKSKFFQASTSEIYGDPQQHPQRESYYGYVNPLGQRACYDEGKRVAETLCMEYHRCHQLEMSMARIFNTYGPSMHPRDGRVVSNLIIQALTNTPLTLYGDGSQTRSFCYVDDLIEGILLLTAHPDFLGPVNLGNPEEITILELAKIILELSGSSSVIHYHPLPEGDPRLRRPDITKAQQSLGWVPKTSLKEGLLKTITHFDKVLSGAKALYL
jgi:UDP-glucuronate decarboxylase